MVKGAMLQTLSSSFEQASLYIVALMEDMLMQTRPNILAALVAAVVSVPMFILALFYVAWVYL